MRLPDYTSITAPSGQIYFNQKKQLIPIYKNSGKKTPESLAQGMNCRF